MKLYLSHHHIGVHHLGAHHAHDRVAHHTGPHGSGPRALCKIRLVRQRPPLRTRGLVVVLPFIPVTFIIVRKQQY